MQDAAWAVRVPAPGPAPSPAAHLPLRFTSMCSCVCVWQGNALLKSRVWSSFNYNSMSSTELAQQVVAAELPNNNKNIYHIPSSEHPIGNLEADASTAAQITWHKMFFNWLNIDNELFYFLMALKCYQKRSNKNKYLISKPAEFVGRPQTLTYLNNQFIKEKAHKCLKMHRTPAHISKTHVYR